MRCSGNFMLQIASPLVPTVAARKITSSASASSTLVRERSATSEHQDQGDELSASTISDKSSSDIQDHLTKQREAFDAASSFFSSDQAWPPEVVPILQWIAKRALMETISSSKAQSKIQDADVCSDDDDDGNVDNRLKILDVGCGAGALFQHYIDAANDLGVQLDITAIDLSPKMIQFATENAQKISQSSTTGNHTIACITGDFVQQIMGVDLCHPTLSGFDTGIQNEATCRYRGAFDTVVINACYGNFYDANSANIAAATCLKNSEVFIIAHPLGSEFVAKLNRESPSTVPGKLPTKHELLSSSDGKLMQFQPSELISYADEAKIEGDTTKTVYYASMQTLPHCKLRNIILYVYEEQSTRGMDGVVKSLDFQLPIYHHHSSPMH